MVSATLGRLACIAAAATLLSTSTAARSPGPEGPRAKPGASTTKADTAHSTKGHGKGKAHPPRPLIDTSRGPNPATGVQRDGKGRIQRSARARADFRKAYPCPSTGKRSGACPGFVIDHVVPLKRHGADAPSNMQWQTRAEARAKDRTE